MNQKTILRSVLAAVLSLVATAATAHDFEVDGIYYNYNDDGTVSVTYQGSSYNEYADEYTGDVVIPSSVKYDGTTYSVTLISNEAFRGCSGLKSVTIPNSVNSIGNEAFLYCHGLTRVDISSIEAWVGIKFDAYSNPLSYAHHLYLNGEEVKDLVIPNSVTSIGDNAFEGCSGLTSITIPNSVTSIGNSAFYKCSGLSSVTIPNSVTSISGGTFSGCSGLTSVSIPNSVSSIGESAFQNCSGLASVTIGNSVAKIGNEAFNGCRSLTSVTIPNSVSSIGRNAFWDCSGLTSVTISNSVTEIGDGAFRNCSGLTSITIPNSVTSIGIAAFAGCSGLTRVDISSIEAWLGIKFNSTTSNPLCYAYYATHLYLNGEEVKDLVIPNSVTSIGDYAFAGCSGLTSVSIPNSVTSIGSHAFYECSGLTSITIGNSVAKIGDFAFYFCSGLTSVTIPNSVTSIGNYAFEGCSGLTSITIPNSVTSIGYQAFENCSGLTSVTIGNSVAKIGYEAFNGCRSLTSIKVHSDNQTYDSRNDCNAIIETATNALHTGCKNTIIPNSVTSIGIYAFYNCSGLTSVTIPNSVTSIDCRAFSGCSGLTSVTIPNSVSEIDSYAFEYCRGLTSVISKAVTPPTCGSDVFSTETYSKPLIVPSVAKEAYQAASIWRGFSNYAEPERKITAMEFGASTFGIENGKTLQLSATVTPEDATFADVLQWESSNPEVATVDNEGLVTSLALGSTVITATSCDYSNISATCTVVVCEKAANVNDLVSGSNIVGFGLQGVKMHNGVLYACTTTESVNKSTPTLHGNNPNNMAPYEDHNFAEFNQRDWVAISGLEEGFVGKELSYPFEATFTDGVLTPSETITATAATKAYTLNTFRAENILHGGYSNYAEVDYTAYYVPARVNEVAKFMGLIETVGDAKYLYSNNAYGRKDGEGIKVDNCTIADNSEVYSLLEGILMADASTKAGVKIIMLNYVGEATGVEGVDAAAARIYSANGNIVIAAAEDGEAAVYDFTGRLIKSVTVVAGDNTAVPVIPGCYIVRTGATTQSIVVK